MAALNEMSAEYKNTFIRYTNLLDTIGLGLFDEPNKLFKSQNVKLVVFIGTFLPFVCIQFSLMTKLNKDNFLEVAQVVPLLVMFIVDILKIMIIITNRQEIRSLFVEIGRLWPSEAQRTAKHGEIIKMFSEKHKKFMNIFFTYAATNLFMYELIPMGTTVVTALFGGQTYFLPFQVPEFWPLNSMLAYFVTWLIELISTVPCQLCLYLPTDLVIVIFCSNLSILYSLVQYDLENAIQRWDKEDNTKRQLYLSDVESFDRVKMAVTTHQHLLRITNKVSDIFGILLLAHIACSSIVICFFGFLAVAYGTIVDKISYCITVLNGIFMIFILAVAGQLLYDTSSHVSEAAYQSLWYESDVKVRKLMLFIITRAQSPGYLSALGYSDMTLRTFSKIMSSAWTYFNLLIQVFEDN